MSTISGSHVRSDNPANPDVINTLGESSVEIRALPAAPPLSDNVDRNSGKSRLGMRYAPGKRDFLNDKRQLYCEHDGRGTDGAGWYGFLMTRRIIGSAGIKNAGNKPVRRPISSYGPILFTGDDHGHDRT